MGFLFAHLADDCGYLYAMKLPLPGASSEQVMDSAQGIIRRGGGHLRVAMCAYEVENGRRYPVQCEDWKATFLFSEILQAWNRQYDEDWVLAYLASTRHAVTDVVDFAYDRLIGDIQVVRDFSSYLALYERLFGDCEFLHSMAEEVHMSDERLAEAYFRRAQNIESHLDLSVAVRF